MTCWFPFHEAVLIAGANEGAQTFIFLRLSPSFALEGGSLHRAATPDVQPARGAATRRYAAARGRVNARQVNGSKPRIRLMKP